VEEEGGGWGSSNVTQGWGLVDQEDQLNQPDAMINLSET